MVRRIKRGQGEEREKRRSRRNRKDGVGSKYRVTSKKRGLPRREKKKAKKGRRRRRRAVTQKRAGVRRAHQREAGRAMPRVALEGYAKGLSGNAGSISGGKKGKKKSKSPSQGKKMVFGTYARGASTGRRAKVLRRRQRQGKGRIQREVRNSSKFRGKSSGKKKSQK